MPEKQSIQGLLVSIDIFKDLKKEELTAIAKLAREKKYEANEIVYKQGAESDSFEVVQDGLFDVFLWDDLLKVERPLGVLKKGEIFGEMGLLTGDRRSAFIRCKEGGRTLRFEKKSFFSFLEKNSRISLGIARTLVHRLRHANQARRIPFENISRFKVSADLVKLLPLQIILRHKMLPLEAHEHHLKVGLVDPSDLVGRNIAAEFLNKYRLEWVCVSQPDFEHFRDRKLHEILEKVILDGDEAGKQLAFLTGNTLAAGDLNAPVSRKLNAILQQAIETSASDLHFEPGPNGVNVRARIDGHMIQHASILGFQEYKAMASRIKVIADLDITETRLPQEAAVRAKYGDRHIDFRISTLPTPRGESVVMRLLDPQQRQLDLHNLIVNELVADLVAELFFQPAGLLLVTGPTGSGKTTTLYAGIQTRLTTNPTDKLITAEDPVEYEFDHATQVQVNEIVGLDFTKILRSLLRQDPDVVLVGEMRDKSSMDIALEAALTGHFVMSSLHTNDAIETVVRLRQRGVEPYFIASALKGVISQRLVSKICPVCAEDGVPTEKDIKALAAAGIIQPHEKPRIKTARGCTECRMSGSKGRIGVYEVLVMSDALRRAIERNGNSADLLTAAPPESYLPMRRYARFLLEKGLVSPSEIAEIFPSTEMMEAEPVKKPRARKKAALNKRKAA